MRTRNIWVRTAPRPEAWAGVLLLTLVAWLAAPPLTAQQASVGGVVVAADNLQPLAGASVQVDGTTRGTITDDRGRFLLSGVPAGAFTLRASMIGYRTVTAAARGGAMDVQIALEASAIELDRIIVTGTVGGQTKRALGNSISTLDATEITAKAAPSTLAQMLNGRTPGVTIINTTGMLGGSTRVRIRGANSFSLSGEPLVYIDGVRVNNDQNTGPISQAFGSRAISRWNDINPEDIESIEVIKGPAAATLYGTEAANGVIQIITKRGRAGAPRLNVSIKQGANWFADPEERLWVNYFDVGNDGSIETIDQVELEAERGNDIWRTGHVQEYDISMAGGADLIRYYVAANVENSTGVEFDNDVERWGGRLNLTVTPNDNWEIGGNVGYTTGRTNLAFEAGGGGATWTTYYARPDQNAPVTISGEVVDNPRRGFWSGTPESYTEGFDSWQDVDRTTTSLSIQHRPVNWFSHRLTTGYDHTRQQDNEIQHNDPRWVYFFSFSNRGYREMWEYNIDYATVDYSGTVDYGLTAGLESSTSVGAQLYSRNTDVVYAYGEVWPVPGLTSIDATTTGFSTGQTVVENVTAGVFFQEQLAWQNRLFLTGAIRADDNSSFGEDFDFVTYPKVSAAWVISEEPFWTLAPVTTLKLRAAYGESGQQPGTFDAIRTFAPATGPNDTGTVTPSNLGNPELGPEVGKEVELGFDAAFLDDRVGVEFTYYNARTVDAILSREIAPSTGFAGNQFVNVGEIKNSGVELLVRGEPWRSDRHSLEVGFNMSTNDNEVISLGDIAEQDDFEDVWISGGTFLRHQVGYPVGSWFSKRVVSATLTGTGAAATVSNIMCDNGEGGEVDCADAPAVFLGGTLPKVEGGFNATLSLFGNLRLFGQLDFKTGFQKLDGNFRVRCVLFLECRENWFPEEFDGAYIAMIRNSSYGDVMIDDASFTKLRELSASYTLPSGWANRLGAGGASITLAGRNLMTWTGFGGLEPESTFAGGSRGGNHSLWEQNVLPQLAQFVATINFSF